MKINDHLYEHNVIVMAIGCLVLTEDNVLHSFCMDISQNSQIHIVMGQ